VRGSTNPIELDLDEPVVISSTETEGSLRRKRKREARAREAAEQQSAVVDISAAETEAVPAKPAAASGPADEPEPPEEFCDPVTFEVMADPVITPQVSVSDKGMHGVQCSVLSMDRP
jgi:hypothetical protein